MDVTEELKVTSNGYSIEVTVFDVNKGIGTTINAKDALVLAAMLTKYATEILSDE